MTQELKLKIIKGGWLPEFELEEDYLYEFQHGLDRASFIIPAGFRYDGATLGSLLFWRKSVHTSPHTLMHDYCYAMLGDVGAEIKGKSKFSMTKQRIDELFLQGIRRETNVQDWRALVASVMIKSVGSVFWLRRKLWVKMK